MTHSRTRIGRLNLVVGLVALAGMLVPTTNVSATIIRTPPYADVFGGRWNDLDTTQAATNSYSWMDTGYRRFKSTSPTAAGAMGTYYAQSDAMWITFGHGGPGFITFCSPPGGSSCTTVLRANSTIGSCASPNACLSSYSGTKINRMKLMAFVGCETASSASSGANLLTTAIADGVDSTVGFTTLIYFGFPSGGGEFWAAQFSYAMSIGRTVSQSTIDALNEVKGRNLGFPFGYDGYVIKNGGTKTHPAAYGTS